MDNPSSQISLSDIRNPSEIISDACDRLQMVSLTRQQADVNRDSLRQQILNEKVNPDIATTRSFDVHLDLIWFLIPMFLFRLIFERHFIKGVPKEVEINLSRLAYPWGKSVNNAIDAMCIRATGYIHAELATIETLLSRTQGQTVD